MPENTTASAEDPANTTTSSSIPVSEASPILTSFTTFLTLAIHSLLFHRNLYPPTTFLTARAYNLPVQQSRHPGVCTWVNDAVAAVARQLQLSTLRRIVFVVHAPSKSSFRVLERWVFDVARFPEWGRLVLLENQDSTTVGEDADGETEEQIVEELLQEQQQQQQQQEVNWTDVNESLRGALRRLAYAAEKMPNLQAGCTFTLAAELRDEAPAPIGHPQDWIPSEPNLQPKAKTAASSSPPGAVTTPIRSVQAGPLFFECWIEQPAPASENTSKEPSSRESQNTRSALS